MPKSRKARPFAASIYCRATGQKTVAGGSHNTVLNRFMDDSTGRRVVAGPSEATATGNILVRAMGAGELSGLADALG